MAGPAVEPRSEILPSLEDGVVSAVGLEVLVVPPRSQVNLVLAGTLLLQHLSGGTVQLWSPKGAA